MICSVAGKTTGPSSALVVSTVGWVQCAMPCAAHHTPRLSRRALRSYIRLSPFRVWTAMDANGRSHTIMSERACLRLFAESWVARNRDNTWKSYPGFDQFQNLGLWDTRSGTTLVPDSRQVLGLFDRKKIMLALPCPGHSARACWTWGGAGQSHTALLFIYIPILWPCLLAYFLRRPRIADPRITGYWGL